MKEKKVAVFLADGFEEVEAITPVDLLQRAGITVDTVSITDDNLVESARKVKILADKVIGEIDFSEYDIDDLGKKIENYTELFPKKVNVNFVKVIDRNNMEVITWERGAGRTLACGTGATASAVLGRVFDLTDEKVNVKVPGGRLTIEYGHNGEDVFMTGTSEKIAEGNYIYKR